MRYASGRIPAALLVWTLAACGGADDAVDAPQDPVDLTADDPRSCESVRVAAYIVHALHGRGPLHGPGHLRRTRRLLRGLPETGSREIRASSAEDL